MAWRADAAAASFVFALAAGACSDDVPEEVPEETVEPVRRHGGHSTGHTAGAHAPSGPAPLARVRRGPGQGAGVGAGAELRAEGAPIVLDLRDGARVELLEGAHARLTDEAPAQLILARGAAHLVLPPMGSSPRPPLRVGTPAASLVIGGSGDGWVLVLPDGRVWVAMTGGRAELETPDGSSVVVVAGRAIVAGAAETTAGPEDEEAARGMLSAMQNDADVDATIPRERLDAALVRLDEATGAAEASWQEGEAVRAAHREAASSGGNTRETLRALARFGQDTQAVRDALRLQYEVARALSTRLGDQPDPVASRRRRVRAALRLGEDE